VEADRSEALRLAKLAGAAGAREGAALAAAIRKEMGVVAVAPARTAAKKKATTAASRGARGNAKATSTSTSNANANANASTNSNANTTPTSNATQPAGADDEEDESESLDPALEKALADGEDAGEAAQQPAAEDAPARISDVKTWSNTEYTRVAIYLSRAVEFAQEEIPADGARPRRLALDLAPAALDAPLQRGTGDAVVTGVRAAQRDARTVRVVLDLGGREKASVLRLDDPPRILVDVAAPPRAPEPAPGSGRAAAPAGVAVEEMGARRGVRRIVVDAGHGGHDTGAIGPSGVREKDVTLAMAQRLARRLAARGYDVVLTRRDDRYVPLEERTAIANARRGDLFVSLHANAHPRRDRHGVETYVLELADGRYARRLAARENGALDGASESRDVRRILADLDAQSSSEPSRRLAGDVQRELCAGIRGRVGDVRDLGVKSALFHVLVGARMPAVLVETSFISNPAEERRLASARFQDEVAVSVARAIDRFAAREARVASAR
jgi:N-acetylmuramoyl-L-alanine amidase